MIKYHGTPISKPIDFKRALGGRNVLVPFPRKEDYKRAVKYCDKIMLDNGAYSVWKKGIKINWNKYYDWVKTCIDDITHFIIPDVIGGTEVENDELIYAFLNTYSYLPLYPKAIPVWHVNESFERLERLMAMFDYIGIGSAGEYSIVGDTKWHTRMAKVMEVLCYSDGSPKVKVHMLRCLNWKVFTKYPFFSGDSTNLGRNHPRDGWENILNRVEPHNSPTKYTFKEYIC